MDKDSFVFYRSFAEAIDDLPDDEQLKLYRAIKNYALNYIEPNLTGVSKTLWKLIKPQLDANNKRFEDGQRGKGYGKQGGRPKKEPHTTNINNPSGVIGENPSGVIDENPSGNFLETPNVNVNVNVNVNENENENENEEGFSFSGFEEKEDIKPPDPLPDKPSASKEDATAVFQLARNLWNELLLPPECRDLIIPPAEYDCLRTFQHYSWEEIKNSIRNYDWHKKGRCGEGYARPPPYGSIYGFLKKGVERYFNDDALDPQFREKEAVNGGRR